MSSTHTPNTQSSQNEVGSKTRLHQNKPSDSKFKQQKLPAWQPILTACCVLSLFFAVALSFISFGIAFLAINLNVRETVIDYTNCMSESNSQISCSKVRHKPCKCNISFTLDYDFPVCNLNLEFSSFFFIKSPVYMYYGLKNFYQSHRRYMKSKDANQLQGSTDKNVSDDCFPFKFSPDTYNQLAPCGAIANSLFNDSFNLTYRSENSYPVKLLGNDIAWKTDIDYKYGNPPDFNSTHPGQTFSEFYKPPYWPFPIYEMVNYNKDRLGYKNEDFIVWMRTSAFPTFRKFHRRISHEGFFSKGLKKGDYVLSVDYNFQVSDFEGRKRVILTTTSFMGGKNTFLGVAYLVVGTISLILGISFSIIHLRIGRQTYGAISIPISKELAFFDTTLQEKLIAKQKYDQQTIKCF